MMRFDAQISNLARTQQDLAEAAEKASLQKRHLDNVSQIGGSKEVLANRMQIRRYETIENNETIALAEARLAATTFTGMRATLDKILSDASEGGSDTAGDDELLIFGQQLRGFAKDFLDAANTQINGKYIFAGKGSQNKVFDVGEDEIIVNGSYLEGNSYAGDRVVEGKKASVGLDDLFSATESSATYTGDTIATLPLASTAEANIIINNGKQEYILGDISFSAGSSGAQIATTINNAFAAKGGQGTVVSFTGGKLVFDNDNITDAEKNSSSAIIINPGSTLPNTLDDLGLTAGNNLGTNTSIQNAFTQLENAYNSLDNELVRLAAVHIRDLMDDLDLAETRLGDIEAKFTGSVQKNFDIKTDLEIKESEIDTLPVTEAIQALNAQRASYGAAIQAGQFLTGASIFNFVRL